MIIRRKIYLIDNFKANMFFDNNILSSKIIVINIVKKFVIIESIDAFISLKTRFDKIVVQHSIHLRKTAIISSYSKITISINHLTLLTIKNFLFELNNDLNVFIYVYLIDVFIVAVLIRNDKNVSIKIFRNFRLDQVFEIDYSNTFHIKNVFEKIRNLIVKRPKFTHKNN